MTSSLVTLNGEKPSLLPTVEPAEYGDACRGSGLLFLEGAREGVGWGKRQLADWLVGPYQMVSAKLGVGASMIPSPLAVSDTSVEELVDLVRIAVTSTLADLARGDTSCISEAIREGIIVSAPDTRGLVWVPADRPRMRLEARVLSMFVADYMLRPEPYESDLAVCSDCEGVSFAGREVRCARCRFSEQEHPSHVRMSEGRIGLVSRTKSG